MDEMEVYMKKSRVTCKRFRNMQCYTDTEHLDCAKCEKFEPLDNIADDSEKVSYNVNSPAHYDEIKLKHCPFCGGKAELKRSVGFGFGIEQAYVECVDCGATTKMIAPSLKYCANNKAAELWNYREEEKPDPWECQGNIGG